jgi:hypothetical protein
VGGCCLKLCGLLSFVRSIAIPTLHSSGMGCITPRRCAALQSENDRAEHAILWVGIAENCQDKLSTASGLIYPVCPSQERKLFLCLAMLELIGCLVSLPSSR